MCLRSSVFHTKLKIKVQNNRNMKLAGRMYTARTVSANQMEEWPISRFSLGSFFFSYQWVVCCVFSNYHQGQVTDCAEQRKPAILFFLNSCNSSWGAPRTAGRCKSSTVFWNCPAGLPTVSYGQPVREVTTKQPNLFLNCILLSSKQSVSQNVTKSSHLGQK